MRIFSIGLQRGEGPGRALAHGSGSTARGRARALETARGNLPGLTPVNAVHGSGKRNGKRKDCLQ